MKSEQEFTPRNPRMRIYIAREDAHKKVKAVIERHLEAMSDEVAMVLAKSIDLDSEFGKTLERFICINDSKDGSAEKTEIRLGKHVVSVSKPTLPETFNGYVNSTVYLKGKKEGCFPFDIYFQLQPFDYKKRAIDDLHTWHNNLKINHEDDPSATDMPEEVVFRLTDLLSEIEGELVELVNEDDEDGFWGKVKSLEWDIEDADRILSKYNEDWANNKQLLKFY